MERIATKAGMAHVMLLLGGNIGEVVERIERGVDLLRSSVGEPLRRSSMMVSEAWGFNAESAPFTNQAVEFSTQLTPEELLEATQSVELALGRNREEEAKEKMARGERYASRGIDIDIIFYDEIIYRSERLSIPHPLMQEREFVLRPIVQIAPEWRNAQYGKSCNVLLDELIGEGNATIERVK